MTPEEEAALIAYKNSDHKIFFAWMNYSPATSSMQTRLRGWYLCALEGISHPPDSVYYSHIR